MDSTRHTTRNDLLETLPGIEHYIPGDPSTKKLVIFSSGGTTGNPLTMIRREPDDTDIMDWYYSGFTQYCRVISRRQIALRVCQSLLSNQSNGKRFFFLSKDDFDLPDVLEKVEEFKPEKLGGSSSALARFFEKLNLTKRSHFLSSSIKAIIFHSELISRALYRQVRSDFPDADIEFYYSFTESSINLGRSCPHIIKKYYERNGCTAVHPIFDTEIADLSEDAIGEIVISTHELHKYHTGDIGTLIEEQCPCGSKKTLLIYGREDRVHCLGATFLASEVDKIFDTLSAYVKDYRLEVSQENNRAKEIGKVAISILPTQKLRSHESAEKLIADTVFENLYITPTRTLATLVREGLFTNPVIKFVDSLPTSIKQRRLTKRI